MIVRRAQPNDGPDLLALVHSLAEFEELTPPTDEAGARLLRDAFTESPPFQLWVADADGELAGYAVTFLTYSTFRAQPTLYLEDLFVARGHRRKGIGRKILSHLHSEAERLGCGRFEWVVLDWNEGAVALYKKFGAEILADFRICRVEL